MLDTNAWIDLAEDRDPYVSRLFRFKDEGFVDLHKCDVVDTERTEGVSDELATARILETAGTIEVLGPAVSNHGRLFHSVYASEDDERRLDRVFGLLFPNRGRDGSSVTEVHSLRDAMQVATAIRYGYEAFVTSDPEVLRGATRIHEQRDWHLRILRPADAVRWVEQAQARTLERERRRQAPRPPDT